MLLEQPRKAIVGFWHIGALGDWRRIVGEQYAKLRASGLYDASAKIVVGFIGGEAQLGQLLAAIREDPKFDVFATARVQDYEFPTIARLWQEAQQRQGAFLCYYFHTKGASMVDTPLAAAANAWRVYMEYFNLEKWEDCVAALEDHDTCGVEWHGGHYSGNFWWATSDYVRKLPDGARFWRENHDQRHAAETYVGTAIPRAHCFRDFVDNLYDNVLPPEAYR